MNDFSSMGLNEPIVSAIKKLGFKKPTEVQQKSIPLLIEKRTSNCELLDFDFP